MTCTLCRPLASSSGCAVVRAAQDCGKGYVGWTASTAWLNAGRILRLHENLRGQPTIVTSVMSLNTDQYMIRLVRVPSLNNARCTIHASMHAGSLYLLTHWTFFACGAPVRFRECSSAL